jgi:hypothetical protein
MLSFTKTSDLFSQCLSSRTRRTTTGASLGLESFEGPLGNDDPTSWSGSPRLRDRIARVSNGNFWSWSS